jgi:hypothetical protein
LGTLQFVGLPDPKRVAWWSAWKTRIWWAVGMKPSIVLALFATWVAPLAAACDKSEAPPAPTSAPAEGAAPSPTTSTPVAPAPSASAASAQPPETASGLDPAQLKATMNAASAQVRACFDRDGKGPPKTGGSIFLRVEIDASGHVGSARVADTPPTTLKDQKLTNCLVAVVQGLQFPPSRDGQPTLVPSLPFRLNVEE